MYLKFGLRELDFFRKYVVMVRNTFANHSAQEIRLQKKEFDGSNLAYLTNMKEEEEMYRHKAELRNKRAKFILTEETKVYIYIYI